MEKKETRENDSNINSEVRTIRISYSLDATPEKVKNCCGIF